MLGAVSIVLSGNCVISAALRSDGSVSLVLSTNCVISLVLSDSGVETASGIGVTGTGAGIDTAGTVGSVTLSGDAGRVAVKLVGSVDGVEVDVKSVGILSNGSDSPVGDTGGLSGVPSTVGASPRICSVCHACSNASANACTLAKRSLGSLASAMSTTCSMAGGIVEVDSRKDGGGTARCWATISVREPSKGRVPLSHSYTTTPSAY